MRTKTRTTTQLKPGMVVRGPGSLAGTPLHAFREVATVTKPTPWAERLITFTDGTRVLRGDGGEFEVARSKTIRNAAKNRAAFISSHALADMLALFGTYARTAVA
ncbi:hypothetical protein ACQP2Y_21080 [Actinoplanes sp. CA-051413]|uniref:hypothetical protein n=1 Tax=Actinoplanes sp. CA-051413 TaxID=3239899 RepID=UPI003D981873